MSGRAQLVLASGSPRRLQLLGQVGIEPARLVPVEIDETPHPTELPRHLAARLAREKATAAMAAVSAVPDETAAPGTPTYLLAADTVVAVGRRILPKAEIMSEATACLKLLSGRAHRVYTGICLVTPKGSIRQRLVESRVKFKRLSRQDQESYLASGEWRGKAGGYAVQGLAAAFVTHLSGSYSNVVGLPLYETVSLLAGEGFPVHFQWIVRD
jgi:septum formation protein